MGGWFRKEIKTVDDLIPTAPPGDSRGIPRFGLS
jgi:hypothetical protein